MMNLILTADRRYVVIFVQVMGWKVENQGWKEDFICDYVANGGFSTDYLNLKEERKSHWEKGA